MEYTEEEILDIVHRWENSGLLYGLPLYEKQELAPIFDNVSRIALSKTDKGQISMNLLEDLENTMFPICRRLYRRVGSDFDIEKMMDNLIKEIKEKQEFLKGPTDSKTTPLVQFCIEFADSYEDEIISKKQFNEIEYEERVEKVLETLRNILLNKEMVSFVDRTNSDWKIMLSDSKKSPKQTRYWNQRIAKEVLTSTLQDTNKGI
jgi:hypothetical protein